ncbi:MAG: hypothetical protein ACD_52C00139G0005 [uncultured bacterium]|uniref:Beta-lactamase class A catalytic domain-containing protein n=1 Tax=Candidatus Woesebacteria bacterium RIFCSPHIGHO2_12_FULL_41_24 TaxID=1802510 RepID=A0A1F8ATS7_9BACT|nr:MAG: hypothetical protein ACD_52C00139G0005 [uncultured bacterium]OGM14583.1 MAG: hypothetical protein A2W15_01315 [Candidatus Woesebacteria bacterium RBG_16_41_13]OGM30409.1 MAG: hypothetical protein A2873_00440 [Candidatus Woesebacteria bacterium RIFCSPHIGHO2_01_FULL_42_80]OGM35455.1 MAG: hypothetical protein A3D84_05755 [Candidatus Woesebacteria bacterium RIFCSPHIGHO2_02_FULL_42_20]OGM55030.1 MAG: hypothetical protein A3E44_04740 [Candidatus Woesebacteria bacterium RIFCSPHIGHO2_12_FULL_41
MKIPFINRNKNRDYEDGESVNEEERLPAKKKFRDLKPENRKHRREPTRPWGAKERVFVFVVLLVTVVASAIGGLSARSWKLPGLPKLKPPQISLPNITGLFSETIVVEKDDDGQTLKDKADEIVSGVSKVTKSLSGVYAFYLVDLGSGFSFGVNQNEVMQAASLMKLPVMTLMYKQSEEELIDLAAIYTLKQEDKVSGSGSLYGRSVGEEFTYEELVLLMGKQSDNTAFNVLRGILGDKNIQEFIDGIGMANTSLVKNTTSAKDIGLFFQRLWDIQLVSKVSRDKILEDLTDTIYEDFLPRGVEKGVEVAHKYGREVHVINDAGIIFAEKPFVLVILSGGIVDKEVEEALPKIISLIFTKWIADGN